MWRVLLECLLDSCQSTIYRNRWSRPDALIYGKAARSNPSIFVNSTVFGSPAFLQLRRFSYTIKEMQKRQ
jgi:hypothetical protein